MTTLYRAAILFTDRAPHVATAVDTVEGGILERDAGGGKTFWPERRIDRIIELDYRI